MAKFAEIIIYIFIILLFYIQKILLKILTLSVL